MQPVSVLEANTIDQRMQLAALGDWLMENLDGAVWAESMSFTTYGVRVAIRANRKGALGRILPCLPPGWKRSQSRVPDRVYSFILGGKRSHENRRLTLLYADESLVAAVSKPGQAIELFESDLKLFVAETAPRTVFVHAGVVAWGGKAVVIPGRSFSGKTTLVAALVKAGATYYSDEYAVLDGHGRVHHYARPLAIRENGRLGRPKKYRVETLGGRQGVKPLPVGMVIMTRFKRGARWRPRRLSEGKGALELMANTVSARREPEAMLEAVRRVVSCATVLKSDRGDAAQVVDFVREEMASC